jgi:hypothetical protein
MLGCILPRKVDSLVTVVDLYISIGQCIQEGEIRRAASLSVIADLFGRFDQKRVKDKTAYQTINDLQIEYMHNQMNKKQLSQFYKYQNRHFDEQSIEFTNTCIFLDQIGYPTYHPNYITSDAKIFKNNNETGLKSVFKPQKNWDNLLSNYLRCG